jgi:hypothetical protein
MRILLDIIRTPDGRYQGQLSGPRTTSRREFAGTLELLEILEQLLLDARADTGRADGASAFPSTAPDGHDRDER